MNMPQKQGVTTKTKGKKLFNVGLIPIKLTGLMVDGARGTYLAYLAAFLTSIGLSAGQAGLITGIRQIPAVFCAPAFGAVADQTGRKTLVMSVLIAGTVLTIFPLPWIAAFTEGKAQDGVNSSCTASPKNASMNNAIGNEECNENKTLLFWIMLLVLCISTCFDQPFYGLVDSITVNIVRQKNVTYGKQKVFGSIGFLLGNLLAGIAADNYKSDTLSSFSAIFFVFLTFILGAIPFLIFLMRQENINYGNKSGKVDSDKRNLHVISTVLGTIFKTDNFIFLLTVLYQGIASANMYAFLFVFMDEEMNATKTNMGLAMAVAAASEIGVFAFSSSFITLFRGTMPCITIGVFSYFLQFILISYLNNPWWILPIRLNHATGFALFWVSMVEHTRIISPPKISASMFGLLNGLFFSLGTCVGTIGGGAFYDEYGGRWLFRCLAAISFCWGVSLLLYIYALKRFSMGRATETKNWDDEPGKVTNAEVIVAVVTNEHV